MNKYYLMWIIGAFCYLGSIMLIEYNSIKGIIQFGLILGMFIFLNESQKIKDSKVYDKNAIGEKSAQ